MTEKNTGKWKYILIKALIAQICFLILHYSYDWWPNSFTRIVSGTSEAVFQHMKIGFFSFALINLVEIILNRKKESKPINFGFARVASAVFYCWPMFILFFTPPAYFGQYPTDVQEIISANIILYSVSLISIIFEKEIEKIQLSKEFKITFSILGVLFLSLLVIYSHRNPWFDVFAIPPGWE